MTGPVNYYMALAYPGGWDRYWCESYESVRARFDALKIRHPEAIGTIVRLRLK